MCLWCLISWSTGILIFLYRLPWFLYLSLQQSRRFHFSFVVLYRLLSGCRPTFSSSSSSAHDFSSFSVRHLLLFSGFADSNLTVLCLFTVLRNGQFFSSFSVTCGMTSLIALPSLNGVYWFQCFNINRFHLRMDFGSKWCNHQKFSDLELKYWARFFSSVGVP